MKRFLTLLLLLAAGVCHADAPSTVARSSFTASNETAYIASSTYLSSIVVGSTSPGVIGVYNSTFSYAPNLLISSVSLSTIFQYDFMDAQLKGIYYKTSGNSAGVTIIWKK